MSSAFLILCFCQIMTAYAGFQDEIVPRAAEVVGGPAACSTVEFAISYCSSVSPGFVTMDPTDQATCLCYSSTAWVPNEFDGAVYTCAQYAATALPASEYSDLVALEGFCSDVGNVETGNSPATVSATTTPIAKATPAPTVAGSVDIFTNTACSFVGFAVSYCNSVSPGFTSMDPTLQAPCLCYSVNPTSTEWLPQIFDGAVSTCAEFVSSAAPSSLSDITPLEDFCTDVGNVLATAGNGVPVVTKTVGGGSTTAKQTATSTPGVAASIATPVATTIAQAPTTSTKSSRASGMRGEVWGFGLLAVAIFMVVLA